jgi:hypothetical protein
MCQEGENRGAIILFECRARGLAVFGQSPSCTSSDCGGRTFRNSPEYAIVDLLFDLLELPVTLPAAGKIALLARELRDASGIGLNVCACYKLWLARSRSDWPSAMTSSITAAPLRMRTSTQQS